MTSINRSLSEMQADIIASTLYYNENITATTTYASDFLDFKRMGEFSLWIFPKLNDGATAPTTLSLTFEKYLKRTIAEGTPFQLVIPQANIIANPKGHIVNVDDLIPQAIFEELKITVASSDITDVDLSIYVIGD